jgi:hypothetical protein
MQMRPAIQIKSMVKAMTDVVLPAIDPANKLAQEQARLVIGMLSLMAQQLPLQFRFDCDELARLLKLSAELKDYTGNSAEVEACVADMKLIATQGTTVLDQAQAGPEQVERVSRELRAAVSQVVRAVYRAEETDAIQRVQDLVLAISKEQLQRDRSWVLMQGWEPDPAAVPDIHDLLRSSAT